jgi:hypothetical protein
MDAGGIIGGNLGLTNKTYNNVSLAKYMSGQYIGGVTALGPTGENNYWLKEPGNDNQPLYAHEYGGTGAGDAAGRRETVAELPIVAAAPMRPVTVRAGSDVNVRALLHPEGGDGAGLSFAWAASKPSVATVSGTGESALITGVAPGTATVTATMSNPAWKGDAKRVTSSVYVTVIPAAGAGDLGLSAYAGNKSVTLGWEAQQDAVKYRVNAGGAWIDLPPDTTDYTFTGLTNNTSYTFTVEAVYAAAPALTDSVTATPTAGQTPPSAPTQLAAAAGDRAVTVSWSAPQNNGGSAITGYEVSGGGDWTPAAYGAMSHTFSGLYIGRTYEFSVRAVNAEGPGEAAAVQAALRSADAPVSAEDAVLDSEGYRDWLVSELGFEDGAVNISEEGYLVIEETSVIDIARAALPELDIDESAVIPLPVVQKEVEQVGGVAAFRFNLDGGSLLAGRAEDVLVMKMLGGSDGELFTYAASPSEFGDRRYTVLRRGAVHFGELQADEKYVLVLFVKDDGDFDILKDDPGRVLDPAAILMPAGAKRVTQPPSGSGGGGCDATGFAALFAFVPAILFIRGSKRGAGRARRG